MVSSPVNITDRSSADTPDNASPATPPNYGLDQEQSAILIGDMPYGANSVHAGATVSLHDNYLDASGNDYFQDPLVGTGFYPIEGNNDFLHNWNILPSQYPFDPSAINPHLPLSWISDQNMMTSLGDNGNHFQEQPRLPIPNPLREPLRNISMENNSLPALDTSYTSHDGYDLPTLDTSFTTHYDYDDATPPALDTSYTTHNGYDDATLPTLDTSFTIHNGHEDVPAVERTHATPPSFDPALEASFILSTLPLSLSPSRPLPFQKSPSSTSTPEAPAYALAAYRTDPLLWDNAQVLFALTNPSSHDFSTSPKLNDDLRSHLALILPSRPLNGGQLLLSTNDVAMTKLLKVDKKGWQTMLARQIVVWRAQSRQFGAWCKVRMGDVDVEKLYRIESLFREHAGTRVRDDVFDVFMAYAKEELKLKKIEEGTQESFFFPGGVVVVWRLPSGAVKVLNGLGTDTKCGKRQAEEKPAQSRGSAQKRKRTSEDEVSRNGDGEAFTAHAPSKRHATNTPMHRSSSHTGAASHIRFSTPVCGPYPPPGLRNINSKDRERNIIANQNIIPSSHQLHLITDTLPTSQNANFTTHPNDSITLPHRKETPLDTTTT
ncbi:hypothetical protein P7C71_g6000, partial [Lecanoromycetidae sp. Uapishka_2]